LGGDGLGVGVGDGIAVVADLGEQVAVEVVGPLVGAAGGHDLRPGLARQAALGVVHEHVGAGEGGGAGGPVEGIVAIGIGAAERGGGGAAGGAAQGLRHQAARCVVAHPLLDAAAAGQSHGERQVIGVVAQAAGVGTGAAHRFAEARLPALGVEAGGDDGGAVGDGVGALLAGDVVAVGGGQAVVGAAGLTVGGVVGRAVGLRLDRTALGLRLADPGDGVAVGVEAGDGDDRAAGGSAAGTGHRRHVQDGAVGGVGRGGVSAVVGVEVCDPMARRVVGVGVDQELGAPPSTIGSTTPHPSTESS